MKEIWKAVHNEEYSDLYEVSNKGRVYSCRSKKIMAPAPNNQGALQVLSVATVKPCPLGRGYKCR